MSDAAPETDLSRLRSIFAEIVGLPPRERAALVESHCGGDQSLRAELLSLLDAADAEDDFLEPPAKVATLAQGESFRLEATRPSGIAADGHLATDARGERVYCALQTLKGDPVQAVQRLRSMGAKLMGLEAPGIARVLEVGLTESQDGLACAYVLSELPPDGGPLLADSGLASMTPEQVASSSEEISSSVAHAHGLALPHGDLRPECVWTDGVGGLQVMGWGAATIARGPAPWERGGAAAMRRERALAELLLKGIPGARG